MVVDDDVLKIVNTFYIFHLSLRQLNPTLSLSLSERGKENLVMVSIIEHFPFLVNGEKCVRNFM